jgi:hypothetical protein
MAKKSHERISFENHMKKKIARSKWSLITLHMTRTLLEKFDTVSRSKIPHGILIQARNKYTIVTRA